MKIILALLLALMVSPCLALTPDDIEEIVERVIEEEATRGYDQKNKHGRFDLLAKSVDDYVIAHLNKLQQPLQRLPEALRHEVKQLSGLLSHQLFNKVKQSCVTYDSLKKAVAVMLSRVVDHSVRYIDKKDIEQHLITSVTDLQKHVGLESHDCSADLQHEMKLCKQRLAKTAHDRLVRCRGSYTTDKELNMLFCQPKQGLLKKMWADAQTQVQAITLAYLAKNHPNDSMYVQPPEAQRLQKVADKIRKMITDW